MANDVYWLIRDRDELSDPNQAYIGNDSIPKHAYFNWSPKLLAKRYGARWEAVAAMDMARICCDCVLVRVTRRRGANAESVEVRKLLSECHAVTDEMSLVEAAKTVLRELEDTTKVLEGQSQSLSSFTHAIINAEVVACKVDTKASCAIAIRDIESRHVPLFSCLETSSPEAWLRAIKTEALRRIAAL